MYKREKETERKCRGEVKVKVGKERSGRSVSLANCRCRGNRRLVTYRNIHLSIYLFFLFCCCSSLTAADSGMAEGVKRERLGHRGNRNRIENVYYGRKKTMIF